LLVIVSETVIPAFPGDIYVYYHRGHPEIAD